MKTCQISNQLNDVELKKEEDSAKCTCCSKPPPGMRHWLSEANHTSALFLALFRSSSSMAFSELLLQESTEGHSGQWKVSPVALVPAASQRAPAGSGRALSAS